jgi:S-(hydroxymethyl)glutathione dehydrogenase / alcohol dehydrogenase
MKSHAAVLRTLKKPLEVVDLEVPPLTRGQVLVEMKVSGICRSQLNEIKGYRGLDRYLPHLLGHEGSGVVIKVGKDVQKVNVGDHIVATWMISAGIQADSPKYRKDDLVVNAGSIATFATYTVLSENRCVKISRSFPHDIAALLGCAVPTGGGIVLHTLPKSVRSVAVLGVGGVGSSAVMVASMVGFKRIIAIDVSKSALDLAHTLGATDCIFYDQDVQTNVRAVIPEGVDASIEASGRPEVMEAALAVTSDSGVTVLAGNIPKGSTIRMDPSVLIRGKKLIGSWGGETNPDKDIPFYVNAHLKGKLPLEKIIGKKMSFHQINDALNLLDSGRVQGRILIDFAASRLYH